MATPCRRVYIGAAQWSPKAKARSFADSTVEAAVQHASHAVLSYAGRWYDAQHPGGVDTLSALAITQGIDRQQWLVSNRRLPPCSVCPRR
jgi:hypothetical protein